jgi:hypothetical protein
MSRKYSVPCPLKAKLLAWTELNINEVDMLINLFHNGSNNNEIYRLIKIFFVYLFKILKSYSLSFLSVIYLLFIFV